MSYNITTDMYCIIVDKAVKKVGLQKGYGWNTPAKRSFFESVFWTLDGHIFRSILCRFLYWLTLKLKIWENYDHVTWWKILGDR